MQSELTEKDWYVMALLEQAAKDPVYLRGLNSALLNGSITERQMEKAAKRLKAEKGIVVNLPTYHICSSMVA